MIGDLNIYNRRTNSILLSMTFQELLLDLCGNIRDGIEPCHTSIVMVYE